MRTAALVAATILISTATLAGCSSGDSAGSSAPAAAPARPGTAAEQAPERTTDQAARAPDLSVDQRSIIYTGSITVRVKNVTVAATQATGIATTAGGFVGGDDRHSSAGSDQATLELRVPADRFAAVVGKLVRLGNEELRSLSTEDVTEQTIDLDARIEVQQARVDSGRKLLARAESLDDLVMLEREVATREADLASLQAKKRRLADLVALSTITVILVDSDATTIGDDDRPPGFLAGLSGGWHALVRSLGVLMTVLGGALPWLVAIGVPLWAVIFLLRRAGRRRTGGVPGPQTRPGLSYAGAQGADSTPTDSSDGPSEPPPRRS
ncbi:DUF4349 domain-containing protein [Mangrovihabitans endophyticus]|uniref:DUF4349 domain-containing protein n=1 Tax=Mangrovihabitans endophyticus TaxID=1751298 RepID=A0A8J3FQN9_9ACTN|nr:DUF4349 domain-containing protein [Mangrovihabitans endophyticus]GGL08687.1 hypothetical protein GCM10012284_49140 [Mangrovihabitans endophyticus]